VAAKPIGDEGKSYQEALGPMDRGESPRGSGRNAITAQQLGGSDSGENLIGRDGISKTMAWRKCGPQGNFAPAETFPVRHAGANRKVGLFSSMIIMTGDR
jgi:hypothetical protein